MPETWTFPTRRPFEVNNILRQRVFEPIEGLDQVIEDGPMLREFPLNILWQGYEQRDEVLAFLYAHRNREVFLYTPECEDDPILVKLISEWREARNFSYGGVVVTFLEVIDDSDYFAPDAPVQIAPVVNSATQVTIACNATTDNVGVTNYWYRVDGGAWVDMVLVRTKALTGLTTGVEYEFEWSATDAEGNRSDPSNLESATPAITYDPDATTFFTAASITDATQKQAVSDLVADLKAYGIWTKMKAIYPFVGGTADKHKYNLKDPQDTDAAHRITWAGSSPPSHGSGGVTGTTTANNANLSDTNLNPNTEGDMANNECIAVYSRVNTTVSTKVLAGGGSIISAIYVAPSGTIGTRQQNATFSTTATDGQWLGFFSISRRSSGNYDLRQNSTNTTISQASTGVTNYDIGVLCRKYGAPSADANCDATIAFLSIGYGLTSTETANLRTAVQDFQTALSRQV